MLSEVSPTGRHFGEGNLLFRTMFLIAAITQDLFLLSGINICLN